MGKVIDDAVNVATLGLVETDYSGKRAMTDAMDAQKGATSEAQGYYRPYQQAGLAALAGLEKPLDIDVTKDPSYQFRLSEAMKAMTAGQAARGGAVGGRAMKELTRYSSDYASQEYGNAYNRENQRLSQLTGLGFNAASGMAGNTLNMGQAQAAARMGQQQMDNQMLGQAVQLGSMAFFSDERLKTNIQEVDKADLAEMRKHLKAYAFNYVSQEHGKGDWIGVMAQEMQKSKLGKSLVYKDNQGFLQIDSNKVLSLFLACMAAE